MLVVAVNLLIYNRFALFCVRIPTKKGNAGLIEGRENEDEKEYILLPPSTEGLIEVDDTLYFIKAVGYLCQLGRE